MKKRMIIIVTTITLALVMTGCGSGDNGALGAAPTKDRSATLSWVAPTTRSDGTPLPISEIAGYKIYEGNTPDNLTLVTNITDPYVMKYKMTELSDGVHYFSVTAYNQDNLESNPSSTVVSKTI